MQQIEKYERVEGTDPTAVFKFKLQNRLECTECHHVKYSSAKAMEISVPIPYDEEQDSALLVFCHCYHMTTATTADAVCCTGDAAINTTVLLLPQDSCNHR
jgi:uncharacterized UBP type Zn finger protein